MKENEQDQSFFSIVIIYRVNFIIDLPVPKDMKLILIRQLSGLGQESLSKLIYCGFLAVPSSFLSL